MGPAMQMNLCLPLWKPVLNTETQVFVDDDDEQGSKGNGRDQGKGERKAKS